MKSRFALLTPLAVVLVSLSILPDAAYAVWPTAEIPVCVSTTTQRLPTVVPDGSGGVVIQWAVGGSGSELWAQRVDSGGNTLWPLNGSYYRFVPGSVGAGTLSRTVGDGLGGVAYAFIENGDVFASHVGPTGVEDWNPHPDLGFGQPVPVCTTSSSVSDVAVAEDGSGGLIVVWSDFRAGVTDRDIYAQRLDASGVPQWTPEGVRISTGAGLFSGAFDPDIAADGSGGAFISWTDDQNGVGEEVYVQHIDGAGNSVWGATETLVAGTPGDSMLNRFSHVIADGTGGVLVFYANEPFSGSGAWESAARVDNTGTRQWARTTTLGYGSSIGYADYVATGDGGLVGIATDGRNFATTGHDLYGVRIDGNGSYLSAPDSTGWPFCIEPGHQRYPVLAMGADGTVWAAWDDQRSGTWNLYYRQFSPDTNPGAAAGDPLDINPVSFIGKHTLAALSDGSIVAAYTDNRNGNSDVFATILAPAATAVGPALATNVSLSANWPNPFGPSTRIAFSVKTAGPVDLSVYDVKGRLVKSLLSAEVAAGRYVAAWDGTTDAGQRAASGVYYLRLHAGTAVMTRRATLVR